MGLITVIGSQALREMSSRIETSPDRGTVLIVTYEGTQDAVYSEVQLVRQQGGRAYGYKYEDPDVYRMDVIYPADDGYFDTWERVREFVAEDIRNSPKRIVAAGTSDNLNKFVHAIRDCIDNGAALATKVPEIGPISADIQDLYDQMVRGQTSIEVDRIVFRRRRIFPIDLIEAINPNPNPIVYTTAALVHYFEVPAAIQAKLPVTPASAPSGRVWAWKIRQDTFTAVSYERKAEVVMDFVFSTWTTGDYDLVDGNGLF